MLPLELPGILSAREVARTVDAIADVQLRSGCIPYEPGGPADPWDHVEAAMALAAGGRVREAQRAYEWLADVQRPDGTWASSYRDRRVCDPTFNTNFCAYPATGVWHQYLATGDAGFLDALWPTVERAVDAVLELQAPSGEIWWARDAAGRTWTEALVTSCSSIYLSLRCAVAIAERVGRERPEWELACGALGHAVAHRAATFWSQDRYSMDWYYPVLAGLATGDDAAARLAEQWDLFVVPGFGVRCVADRPWITGAETCELVLALDAMDHTGEACRLMAWVQRMRHADGSYWTGVNAPGGEPWPDERPTWTAAAVVLAVDALARSSPTSGLFRARDLPRGLDPSETLGDAAQHT